MQGDAADIVLHRLDAVVIGRNEGPRLAAAIGSVVGRTRATVYVDSRSADDSVSLAGGLGAFCVVLGPDIRLSAARARNAGAEALGAQPDSAPYVFFMDGDCVADPDFLRGAVEVLDSDPAVVAVCGWRRERFPTRNVFHRICDVEWHQGGAGEIDAFGGDVVVRAEAFRSAGGYDASLIAGEDPEFSARLRSAGGVIRRLDVVATTHDIDMTRWRQWWRRAERSGFAFGAVADRTRTLATPLFAREVARIVKWGVAAPLIAIVALRWTRLPAAALVARYLVAGARAGRACPNGRSLADRIAWGVSCAASTVPSTIGLVRYARDRRSRSTTIIEYRS